MRVEVVKPFGAWSKGDVIPDMPGNQARALEGRGLVRPAEAPRPAVYTAPADRAMRAAARRRDG